MDRPATVEALGAVPIGMPISDVYEALSGGVVGGVWVAWIITRPFRLHEVARNHNRIRKSLIGSGRV